MLPRICNKFYWEYQGKHQELSENIGKKKLRLEKV